MIQIVQGFKVSTRDPVDNRLLLTKEEMRLVNDNQMPEKYFAVCKDDGTLYLYDKARAVNGETGKFEQFSSATIESITVNGKVLPISNKNVDLPLATAENYGLVLPGKGLTLAENGTMTLDFNAIDDGSIPVEKIDWTDVVIRDHIPG